MHRILVIGERPEDAKALAFRLGLNGFEAAPSAGDITLVLRSLFAFKPDVIVLDSTDNRGAREAFRLLVRVAPVPIFVLGDGRHSDDLVWYLEEGAADYLLKTAGTKLLGARVSSVLRRLKPDGRGSISLGDLVIDLHRHQVRKSGVVIQLTPTEFRLLQVLAEHAGRACSHQMLLQAVWGEDFSQCAHYLRLYVGYLRQKLEADPRNPRLLLTEWGLGYRFVAESLPVSAPAVNPVRAEWA